MQNNNNENKRIVNTEIWAKSWAGFTVSLPGVAVPAPAHRQLRHWT